MKSLSVFFSVLLLVHVLSAFSLAQELAPFSGNLIRHVPENNPAGSLGSKDFINDNELDDLIQSYMDTHHIPGLVASIVKYGDMIWSKAYGFASFNPDIPATEDTVFMLASVSKPITATALMRLYDEGKFDLHDPVNDYLPFEVKHSKYPDTDITFYMVLTHTSGIKDNWIVMKKYPGDPPISLGQYLQDYLCPGGTYYYPNANFTIWEPGTNFKYSNIGAALAGYLVETISGMSLEQYCQQNLFLPLGMNETSWFVSNPVAVEVVP